MQPFAVREARTPTPTALPTGPRSIPWSCRVRSVPRAGRCRVPGSPAGRVQPTGFDAAGQPTGSAWTRDSTCPGIQHAEIGPTGVLETRCSVCGMPP